MLLLSLLAFAGVAGFLLWRLERASVVRQIEAQAEALLAVSAGTPAQLRLAATELLEEQGQAAAARVYQGAALRFLGGAAAPDTLDPTFLNDQEVRATRQSGNFLVTSRRAGEVTVQVGRNLAPLKHLLRRYTLAALLTLLGLSVLLGLVVARAVRRALRPLEALAARVQTLESAEPLPALAEPGEVGALARALDRSLQALRAERAHETLFLASASHELRTPVTAILADVQHTLSRPRSPEDLHAALVRTERTASRLRGLTGNLMNLTRANALPGGAAWPDLDLLTLAGEAVDLLQPLASRRALDLWLDGDSAPLRGDPGLLGGLLENLIGNAIKFTPPGGRVQVVVGPEAGGARLTVQDTGPGFPAGTLTDAFVRGQTDTEGFGLGLAVVRRVVEVHGGTLTLGPAPGGGAQATVWLPPGGPVGTA
ncbi:sensor histidine kinase [Deinococcus multiflagellatus]|uniref:histidine kinase n=1 Tax=Deinococcus multiflagellatus TaxID=1656887 RepID=A0ABW1ZI70_9DEIO|nr:HAMP domain-containing sensor histidine kinase [Deinococcus multiflagellatus]